MANMIEKRAINGNIELASVAIVYDGSTAGSAFVSDAVIPEGSTITGVYLNTSSANGAVLAGTGGLRIAVGGAAQWLTGTLAAAACKAGPAVLFSGANYTGAIHVTATGTVTAVNGVHYITIAYVRGNA
jgi:hypothetical protein